MINWAKFEDPSAVESAFFSDMVYPLNYTVVNQIDSVDHTAALLSSDMLQNAADRRFALAQSSPSRHAYDFHHNKLRQMERAVDTLSTYIHHHRVCQAGRFVAVDERDELRHDLAGMPASVIHEDQMSECHLSPSPQPSKTTLPSIPPSNVPISPPLAPHWASTTAQSTSAGHLDSAHSESRPVSTAPTIFSHGLSIADLIHPPLALPSPSREFSPPLTPDSDLEPDGPNLHAPDLDLLQTTLRSIRADRDIYRSTRVAPLSYYRAACSAAAPTCGRSLRFPRMRRSSRSRRHIEDMAKKPRATSATPAAPPKETDAPTQASQALPVSQRTEPTGNETAVPPIHAKAPSPPPPSLAQHPVEPDPFANRDLDEWWDGQRQIHNCDEYDDVPPTPLEGSPALPSRRPSAAPGLDFAQAPQSRSMSQPLRPGCTIDPMIEVDETYSTGLYAYTRETDAAQSAHPDAARRYGYIAGDVPGVRDVKVRVRGRTRERARGGRQSITNIMQGKEQPRTVSGVKRRREQTPEVQERDVDSKGKGKGKDFATGADFPEADRRLLREAKRRAERWQKEPLVAA